jgi:hypothetical protein
VAKSISEYKICYSPVMTLQFIYRKIQLKKTGKPFRQNNVKDLKHAKQKETLEIMKWNNIYQSK